MSESGIDHTGIQLRFLGSLAVSDGGRDLTSALAQPKRLALVALLALTRPYGLHRRDTLCAHLWPESPDDKARSALRQLLLVLRRELGEDVFVTRGDLVGLNRERVATDAGAVFDALAAGDDAAAVDRYTGELLPGLHLSEGEVFERWFENCRRDLHQGVTRAAWRLVDRAEAGGDVDAARRAAERAMVVDAENEEGLRRLLTLQARSGDRAAALRTADEFARRLRQDWATEPEEATLGLIERIRTRQLAQARPRESPTDPAPVTPIRESAPSDGSGAGSAREKLATDPFDSRESSAETSAQSAIAAGTAGALAGATARKPPRPAVLTGSAAAIVLAAALAALAWLRPAPPPVVRYEIAVPSDQRMMYFFRPQFAFAPDGSWLVYTGFDSSSRETRLWVRPQHRLEATPLPGTAGALTPSVSPDGKWIAFTAAGQLRKVPAGGGSPTTIADGVEPGSPVVWMDDVTLAYTDDQQRLRRVPARGGVPELLIPPGPEGQRAVAALPNRRGVLLLSNADLRVADGRSGEARLLLPGVRWAAYADGRLLFVRRDGAVFGAPFDLATLGMQGDPVSLFDDVRVDDVAQITLSASGTLAYLAGRGRAAAGLSEAVWVSRDGRVATVDPAWEFRLSTAHSWSLSPDGARLAISLTAAGNDDIWIKDLDRGPLSRLTSSEGVDYRPRWTPDGRSVTFISNRAGGADLYERRADGTGADSLVLTLGKGLILEALWSRDRRWIVMRTGGIVTGSLSGGRDLQALEVGRDPLPRPLLTEPHDESAPALSPDGRWLAFLSTETGRPEVFVRPFPDVETAKWQISTNGGFSPVWSHSGRELFFINGNYELVSQAVAAGAVFRRGEQQILFPIDGTFLATNNYAGFDVSPDDQRFLMVRRKAGATDEAQVLIVVENWLEEVRQAVKAR